MIRARQGDRKPGDPESMGPGGWGFKAYARGGRFKPEDGRSLRFPLIRLGLESVYETSSRPPREGIIVSRRKPE